MPVMQSSIMHRLIGRIRAVGKDRRAAAAVELALAMPALCLFIFGIIEVGFALWVQNALDYSVASAARCASLNLTGTSCVGSPSQVTTYAANQSGAYLASTAFTYTPGAACGCQVSASYTIALDIPWDSALSVTLSSNSCVAPPPTKSCAS
jgi:Flp pilus assembly protein TadG